MKGYSRLEKNGNEVIREELKIDNMTETLQNTEQTGNHMKWEWMQTEPRQAYE